MRLRGAIYALLLLLAGCGEYESEPARITGTVVKVFDGDSIIVATRRGEVEVRLGGIDAPEKHQPHSEIARDALEELVLSRSVAVRIVDVDRYQRAVGVVYRTGDELNVNRVLVGEGHAWAYRRYALDPELVALEENAKNKRLGLWRAPADSIVPPWTWRRTHPR